MNLLNNKKCFISGATGGLGREIIKLMAQNKCDLFLTSTSSEKLQLLKQEIGSLYDVKIDYKEGNLNSIEDTNNIIKSTISSFSNVDIVINCAGIFKVKSLFQSSLYDYESCFNINARAPLLFTMAFVEEMKKNKWGRIVNVGSSSAHDGYKDTSAYCMSKHALLGLSRALYQELKMYGVRVFNISPRGMKTKMGKDIPNQNYNNFLDPKDVAQYIVQTILFDNEMIVNEVFLGGMN